MNTLSTDVAILGAGTAGLNARRGAEARGARAVMVDPGPFGTTCARVGCMPSKLLIAAAERAHSAQEAAPFGVQIPQVRVDGPAVMRRVQAERDRFVGFVLEAIDEHLEAGRLIKGRARFVGPNTLQVDEHTQLTFRSAVIATGTTPFVPPPFRGLGDALIDNSGIFELPDLPESVLVVGAGVIGLELGQALHRLGVRVTIVGLGGQIGPLSDPKVLQVAREVFSQELDLRPDYQLESITRLPDGQVEMRADGRVDRYQRVLIASGRLPNLGNLGLEEVFGWDPKALPPVDPRMGQIGDSHIFLGGDVSSFRPLLHEAADEGRIAGENAGRYPAIEARPRRTALGVVFTDPQIAVVGKPYSQTGACGCCAGEVDYSRQGRARVMGRNKGWVRIYAECDQGVLQGAEMFGPDVEHTAHLLAWAIQRRLSVHEALELPFYHPVVEEGIRTALQDLRKNLHFRARTPGCADTRGLL
ncbi:MAG: dihydrolipoyl dehydrogenase [Myxococcota bacterium]|nr:dihydrolipoyl dehydrogenase [Myxococcota bacterium]